MPNQTPLINGKAYDYTQIVATIGGSPLAGITGINYTETQEKVNNFGAGNRPVSRGRGPIDASGSLDIDMNEIEAIRDAAPNRSLLQIPPFDVTVTYLNEQKVITHVLKNVEFLSDGVETSQGDTNISRSFDIVLSHVDYEG